MSNLAKKILGAAYEAPPSPTAGRRIWRPGEDYDYAAGSSKHRLSSLRARRERQKQKLAETDLQITQEERVLARQLAEVEKGAPLFDDLRAEVEAALKRLSGAPPDTREGREERRAEFSAPMCLLSHLIKHVQQEHPAVCRELRGLEAQFHRELEKNRR